MTFKIQTTTMNRVFLRSEMHFLSRKLTINTARYSKTSLNLRRVIESRYQGLLSNGVILFPYNTRPQIAAKITMQLNKCWWELLYSPNLAPLDFHLFSKFKKFLGGNRLENDVKETFTDGGQVVELFDDDIQKLVARA